MSGRRLAMPWSVLALACAWAATAAQAADAVPAPAAADPSAWTYTAVAGDTIIGLGRRWLADPKRWPELARANGMRDANRLATGASLRIPLAWMRTEAEGAQVLSVLGEVRGPGAAAVAAGQALAEGGELSTGPDGHATIRLVDGTLLRLRPASRLQVTESHRVKGAAVQQSGARLERGRVEVEAAPAAAGRPGFRISTPQGVLGVRGTEFRVFADAQLQVTRGEVLGGAVVFEGRPGAPVQRVTQGQGAIIGGDGQVAEAVPLLGAPDVSALPTLQEHLLMRFAVPPMAGATAYRGLIARDAAFEQAVADLTSPTPELRFAVLPDGDYVLRVRAIDARGLEGRDADHRFRLMARPEAPLPSSPTPGTVLRGGQASFSWAANDQAQGYRLRLASDAQFQQVVRDVTGLRQLSTALDGLAPGTYHWQLASLRANGDTGPWGDVLSFEMRPVPVALTPRASIGRTLAFAWDGLPGQSFDFQVARDADFNDLVAERRLDRPSIELPLPSGGRYYVRLRSRDADGYVGPYSSPQHIDLEACVRDGAGGCIRASDETLNLAP